MPEKHRMSFERKNDIASIQELPTFSRCSCVSKDGTVYSTTLTVALNFRASLVVASYELDVTFFDCPFQKAVIEMTVFDCQFYWQSRLFRF